METNKCTTELQSLKHPANNTRITESYARTKIYNENKAALQWEDSVTPKGINHGDLREIWFENFISQKMLTWNISQES